jgi:hypothetical protein
VIPTKKRLSDFGVTANESQRWQQVASIPEEQNGERVVGNGEVNQHNRPSDDATASKPTVALKKRRIVRRFRTSEFRAAKNGDRDRGKGGDRKSPSNDSTVKHPTSKPTLADIGISRDQSSRWRRWLQ